MLTTPILAATALLLVVVIGQVASILSRAWIPSLLVAFIVYLGMRWAGVFPDDITTVSAMGTFGSVIIGVVICHMGTMIPLDRLKEQWRGIVIALSGVVGIVALVLSIGSLLYGYPTAVAGTGVVAGGVVAFLITSAKLTEIGQEQLIVIPALILGIQSLIGMPVAQVMLRKYAEKLRREGRYDGLQEVAHDAHAHVEHRSLLPKVLRNDPFVLLLLLFALASAAFGLDKLTGLNYGVWALLLGIAGQAIGLLPHSTMEKANSFGLGMALIIVVVLATMNSVTPEAVSRAIVPAVVILLCGLVGIVIFAGITSKLLKWDPLKGMPVALTALFGFPADYLLCQEVARSMGRTPAETKAIMDDIYTPMLIGGFTTVTLSSVVVASILVSTI